MLPEVTSGTPERVVRVDEHVMLDARVVAMAETSAGRGLEPGRKQGALLLDWRGRREGAGRAVVRVRRAVRARVVVVVMAGAMVVVVVSVDVGWCGLSDSVVHGITPKTRREETSP